MHCKRSFFLGLRATCLCSLVTFSLPASGSPFLPTNVASLYPEVPFLLTSLGSGRKLGGDWLDDSAADASRLILASVESGDDDSENDNGDDSGSGDSDSDSDDSDSDDGTSGDDDTVEDDSGDDSDSGDDDSDGKEENEENDGDYNDPGGEAASGGTDGGGTDSGGTDSGGTSGGGTSGGGTSGGGVDGGDTNGGGTDGGGTSAGDTGGGSTDSGDTGGDVGNPSEPKPGETATVPGAFIARPDSTDTAAVRPRIGSGGGSWSRAASSDDNPFEPYFENNVSPQNLAKILAYFGLLDRFAALPDDGQVDIVWLEFERKASLKGLSAVIDGTAQAPDMSAVAGKLAVLVFLDQSTLTKGSDVVAVFGNADADGADKARRRPLR